MSAKRIENLPVGMMFCIVDTISRVNKTHTYYILKEVKGLMAVCDKVFCIGLTDEKPTEMRAAPERNVEVKSNIFVLPITQRRNDNEISVPAGKSG